MDDVGAHTDLSGWGGEKAGGGTSKEPRRREEEGSQTPSLQAPQEGCSRSEKVTIHHGNVKEEEDEGEDQQSAN